MNEFEGTLAESEAAEAEAANRMRAARRRAMPPRVQIIEGLETFGAVEIRNVTRQAHAGRYIGVVLVPRDWPGSSNVGAPNSNVSLVTVCWYAAARGWELV